MTGKNEKSNLPKVKIRGTDENGRPYTRELNPEEQAEVDELLSRELRGKTIFERLGIRREEKRSGPWPTSVPEGRKIVGRVRRVVLRD